MRTLILNSSQHRLPVGTEPWVQATLAAVNYAASLGHEIVASVGLPSWELSLWQCAQIDAFAHIVCPIPHEACEKNTAAAWTTSFRLRPDLVQWHWIPSSSRSPKTAWVLRDKTSIDISDTILAVSIRPSGRLDQLLRESGRDISAEFSVPWSRTTRSLRWEKRIPPDPATLWKPGSIVHLTRASVGPWPDETHSQYYQDVTMSVANYARSGFATLKRIVEEQRIRGSTFRARCGVARVCLSACSEKEALRLVRFRARYARYSFEPYCVVLAQDAVKKAGGRPVTYGNGSKDDPFVQGEGENGNWRGEREWRVFGDLDLRAIRVSDILVVTATDSEAEELRRQSPYRVASFGCV